QRIRTLRLNDVHPRHAIDEPDFISLIKTFAESGTVSEIAARHDDVRRRSPSELLKHFNRYRLLPFKTKRIDRIEEVEIGFAAQFENKVHCRVEIALDLQCLCAVIQTLREFAVSDLPSGNEDCGDHSRSRRISGHRRGSVSGA